MAWLSSEKLGLKEYATAFQEFKVDGRMLRDLTGTSLSSFERTCS